MIDLRRHSRSPSGENRENKKGICVQSEIQLLKKALLSKADLVEMCRAIAAGTGGEIEQTTDIFTKRKTACIPSERSCVLH